MWPRLDTRGPSDLVGGAWISQAASPVLARRLLETVRGRACVEDGALPIRRCGTSPALWVPTALPLIVVQLTLEVAERRQEISSSSGCL